MRSPERDIVSISLVSADIGKQVERAGDQHAWAKGTRAPKRPVGVVDRLHHLEPAPTQLSYLRAIGAVGPPADTETDSGANPDPDPGNFPPH
jgi:hypothetical protein